VHGTVPGTALSAEMEVMHVQLGRAAVENPLAGERDVYRVIGASVRHDMDINGLGPTAHERLTRNLGQDVRDGLTLVLRKDTN